jgi:hypothetical protein
MAKVPLVPWLDENVEGWRELTPPGLRVEMYRRWKAGEFQKLYSATRNSPVEIVEIGNTSFAYLQEPFFKLGHRYRVTILPAGARTRTVTFDGNYLGPSHMRGCYTFDCRPEAGTQEISGESIKKIVLLGLSSNITGRRGSRG